MAVEAVGPRDRDMGLGGEALTPKNHAGKSFMRIRTTTPTPSHPKMPGSAAGTRAGSHRVAVPATAATPYLVRAIPAKISESLRDPRKIPVAAIPTVSTPPIASSPAPRLASRITPGTMSSRKLDGVHSLSALLEKQGQESARPKSKFARNTQAKAKAEKFDPRAQDSDSDSDDSSSNSDSSDDDGPANPEFFAKINGQMASSKPASTPLKKAKRGKDDEVADSDVEHKTSTAKSTTTKKAPVKPESSSGESSADEAAAETDSSDSSDSESEGEPTEKKPAQNAAKKTPATNGTSTTSSSDSESDSESDNEKTSKPKAKPTVNGAKTTKPASTSSSEASSSSDEESSEDEAEEEEESSSDEEESEKETAAVAPRRNSKDLNVPGFVGKDFVLRQAQGDEDGKDMTDFFTKAKLDGKQLWYFTAPASIPINVVEKLQIPLDKAHKGEAIFKHNSEDYTVGFDVGATAVELLIPNKKGNRYETAPKKVDKVLHVKRVTQLVGSEPGAPRPVQPNLPRPQPQGLRARFHPIGVPDDTPMGKIGFDESSDEDVEMASAPALPTRTKKSKHAQPAAPAGDAMDIDEPTPKSSKKDKKKSKATKDPVQDSQSTIIEVPNSQPLPTTKEKQSKKRRDSIESISSVGSNPKPTLATPSQSKKASKRKLPTDEEESTPAQLSKEKAKKVKRDASSQDDVAQGSAKKVTAIPLPTIPKPSFSFSSLPAGSSPAPETSTPQPKTKPKSSKKSKADEPASSRKETPVQPPGIRRESAVPIPQVPFRSSPAAEETPKKEKRKRRKSEKTDEPKSSKKETPVPVPGSS
ncbi:hypothetical protein CORC01_00325 [Colletotrichum orchidophilum]|uniref:DNA-directed RNA polymerase I subunit n=1 Tax=Colletotrichum orchidophilum TaxID=1209926 RepID=A0A1G4BSX2_9PEZI|nr:uncharacterized protein CORC01_00325 [Colletotrichum orchidophilum]OHF04473.1 hypothetical protein CORC01_00325 [Colletotrichum orchidophilum]